MFIDNKYTKIYFSLIQKRQYDSLSKDIQYCESHHIIPKSIGGDDTKQNLVNLTPREHYIAHKLLTKMTEGEAKRKMWWAFHMLIHSKNSEFKINSYNYELFRKQWSEFASNNHPSKTTDHWCNAVSESIKESWMNDSSRRDLFSKTMKHSISKWRDENKELFSQKQKESALKSKLKNCKRYEYNGVTYIGLSDLLKATGLTKKKYNYYINGIDPTFRDGKNGPMTIDEIDYMINSFCDKICITRPYGQPQVKEVLLRMVNVALLTNDQLEKYMMIKFSNNSFVKEGSV